jgi:hypothetical protein
MARVRAVVDFPASGYWRPDLDEAIARNWQELKRMKRRKATEWLQENGFRDITEERFRKRLVRLKLTKQPKE